MQANSNAPTSVHAASPILQHHVRRAVWSFWRLRLLQHRVPRRLLNTWCIWNSAFRSLCGYIQTQSSRELPSVAFGPALRELPDGHLVPNTRTLARNPYTEMLSAIYPWIDIPYLRSFLMGFDAGEQWALYSPGSEARKDSVSSWSLPSQKRVVDLFLSHHEGRVLNVAFPWEQGWGTSSFRFKKGAAYRL
jgi:hypothetical protein